MHKHNTADIVIPSELINKIKIAKDYILNGDLVAFPTETVYGLGADATNEQAVLKVYQAKGRPSSHPLIMHIHNLSQLQELAYPNDITYELADAFWPGPLTFILKKKPNVLDVVTGGQETVAIRMPNHPVAQALLTEVDRPLVAPSANLFSQLSPTHAEHVRYYLGDDVGYILDGGNCTEGIESTIINLSGKVPEILRIGAIDKGELEQVLNQQINIVSQSKIKVPGSVKKHYSPLIPLYIIASNLNECNFEYFVQKHRKIALLSYDIYFQQPAHCINFMMPTDPKAYRSAFYHQLYLADISDANVILVQAPPNTDEWLVIHDKLTRAQAKEG